MEMAATRVLGGFPWNFLGSSQYQMLPLIQISAVTGVFGVSFLMAWFACSLFSAGMILTRHQRSRGWSFEIAPPLLVVAIVFANGLSQIRARPVASRSVRIALVQPSIPRPDPDHGPHEVEVTARGER